MTNEWGAIHLCSYFGCGSVARTESQLLSHLATHSGEAPGSVIFPPHSAMMPVAPDVPPRKAGPPVDPHAVAPDGETRFELLLLRVGTTVNESAFPGHLSMSLNVVSGRLVLRQKLQPGAEPLDIIISALGLEDVIIWSNRAADPHVDLVIRARAASFTGPWEAEVVADTRVLITIRMHEVVAHSFLFCLATAVAETAMPPEESTAELRHLRCATLCCTLRKGLVRRDLLNRGWTDEALEKDDRLWSLLARPDSHSWSERHVHAVSGTLAKDAPQLANHVWVQGGVPTDPNLTPNPNVAPPVVRQATRSSRVNGSGSSPVNVPNGSGSAAQGSMWHVSRAALPPSTTLLTNAPLFAQRATAVPAPVLPPAPAPAAAEEAAVPDVLPVYKPKTAYQLYHKYTVAELKRQDPTIKHQQAFKKAGQMWSEMSLAEQAVWKAKADVVPKRKVKKAKLGSRSHALPSSDADPEEFL